MWESIKSKVLAIVSLLSLLLFGVILMQRKKVADSEAEAANEKMKAVDGKLEQHTEDTQAQIEKDKAQAETDKSKTMTNQEIIDFLNKKS